MHKIYKYEIGVLEKQTLNLPKGARIERCEDVEGRFYVWAMVNPDEKETEPRYLEFYKTGAEIHTPMEHLVRIGFCKIYIQMELALYCFENIGAK